MPGGRDAAMTAADDGDVSTRPVHTYSSDDAPPRCGSDGEAADTSSIIIRSFRSRLLQQAAIFNAHVALGAFNEIIGPTLQDLLEMLGVTYEALAEGLAVRAAGFAMGAIIGGIMHDLLHRPPALLVVVGLLLAALGTILLPYSTSVQMFSIVIILPGLGRGILIVGGVVQTMDLWREKSAAPMQALYFATELGAILMTETVRPFLSADRNDSANTTISSTQGTDPIAIRNTTQHNDSILANMTNMTSSSNRLAHPFLIVAAYTILAALIMSLLLCYEIRTFPRHKNKISCKTDLKCTPCGVGHFRAAVMTLCASLYCFHSNGGEQNFMTYLPSYVIDSELQFSKDQATTLITAVRFAMFFARFSGIFLAHFFKIQYIIVVSVLGMVVASSCMSLLSHISVVTLWILAITLGMLISLQYAAGMSLANLYVKTSSLITMVWFLGSALGLLTYEYSTGYLFDEYGVHIFSYTMLICALSLFLLFVVMQTVAQFHDKRFAKASDSLEPFPEHCETP